MHGHTLEHNNFLLLFAITFNRECYHKRRHSTQHKTQRCNAMEYENIEISVNFRLILKI